MKIYRNVLGEIFAPKRRKSYICTKVRVCFYRKTEQL